VFDVTQGDVLITRTERESLKVLNEGSLTVALDPELTDDLIQEGMIRDLVRGVQQLRKDRGLEVTDRIRLYLYGPEEVQEAVESFEEHLTGETLAESWHWEQRADAIRIDCGQEVCLTSLERVGDGSAAADGKPAAREGAGS
jgi:isoleucyl-tRNA synthetase